MYILNLINSLLAYSDPQVTDNPQQQAFNFVRKLPNLCVTNPSSDAKVIAPGGSLTLFDGSVPTLLDNTSVIAIQLLPGQTSNYRVSVTSGPASFRTARATSGVTSVTVTTNNNAIAVFDFGAATITGLVVGDILRISGAALNDTGPFAFSPTNSGLWTVIGIAGGAISCIRPIGQAFSGVAQTVTPNPSDYKFYSAAGIQNGSSIYITGTLSPQSRRAYLVQNVTPTTFDIMSAVPLPNEFGLSYSPGSFVFYTNAKRYLYLEVDQDAAILPNGASQSSDIVNPFQPGSDQYVGFYSKTGITYSATVVNLSVNPLNVKWFAAE
jgi:hypothetical protein